MPGEIASAFVRIRPNMTGFKAETEAGVKSAFSGVSKIIGGALAVGGAFELGKKLVEVASEHQSAFAVLAQTIKNANAANEVYGVGIEALLEREARLKGFSDEELASSFVRLVSVTHDTRRAYEDLGLVEDISRARHLGLAQAALAVSKAEQGSVTSLQRLGIVVPAVSKHVDDLKRRHDEAVAAGAKFTQQQKESYKAALDAADAADKQAKKEEALALIRQRFGGSARTFADTAAGQFARVGQDLHQFAVSFGQEVLPAIAGGAETLGRWVNDLKESGDVQAGAASGLHVLGQAYGAISKIVAVIAPPLETATSAVARFTSVIGAGPLLAGYATFKGIGFAVGAASLALKEIDKVVAAGAASAEADAAANVHVTQSLAGRAAASLRGTTASSEAAAATGREAAATAALTAEIAALTAELAASTPALAAYAAASAEAFAVRAAAPPPAGGRVAVSGEGLAATTALTAEEDALAASIAAVAAATVVETGALTASTAAKGRAVAETAALSGALADVSAIGAGEFAAAAGSLAALSAETHAAAASSVSLAGASGDELAALSAAAAGAAASTVAVVDRAAAYTRLTPLIAEAAAATEAETASVASLTAALDENAAALARKIAAPLAAPVAAPVTPARAAAGVPAPVAPLPPAATAADLTATRALTEESGALTASIGGVAAAAGAETDAITASTAAKIRAAATTGELAGAAAGATGAAAGEAAAAAGDADALRALIETTLAASAAQTELAAETAAASGALAAEGAASERGLSALALRVGAYTTTGSAARGAADAERGVAGAAEKVATSAGAGASRLVTFGRGLLALASSPTAIVIGLGAVAAGITYLLTRESALEKASRALAETLRDLKASMDDLPTDRLSVAEAKLSVATARAQLEQTKAAKGSLEYRQLQLNLAQAEDQRRRAVETLTGAQHRHADSLEKLLGQTQKIADAARQTRTVTTFNSSGQRVSREIEESAKSARRFADSIQSVIDTQKDLDPVLRHNLDLLEQFALRTHRRPTHQEIKIILDNRSATGGLDQVEARLERLLRVDRAVGQVTGFANWARTVKSSGTTAATGFAIYERAAQGVSRSTAATRENAQEVARWAGRVRSATEGLPPLLAHNFGLLVAYARKFGEIPNPVETRVILSNTDAKASLDEFLRALRAGILSAGDAGAATGAAYVTGFRSSFGDLTNVFNTLATEVSAQAGTLSGLVTGATGAIQAAADAEIRKTAEDRQKIVDSVYKAHRQTLDDLKQQLSDAVTSGATAVHDAVVQAQQSLSTLSSSLASDLANILDTGPIGQQLQKLNDGTDQLSKRIAELQGLFDHRAAKEQRQGLVKAIKDAATEGDKAVKDARLALKQKRDAVGAGPFTKSQQADVNLFLKPERDALAKALADRRDKSQSATRALRDFDDQATVASLAKQETAQKDSLGRRLTAEKAFVATRLSNLTAEFNAHKISEPQFRAGVDALLARERSRLEAFAATSRKLVEIPGANVGLVHTGNLDLLHRKVARIGNEIATVKSASVPLAEALDGAGRRVRDLFPKDILDPAKKIEVLLPTVIDGKIVSLKKAVEHFKATGENLGSFASAAAADRYAIRLHDQQAKYYGHGKHLAKSFTDGLSTDPNKVVASLTQGLGFAARSQFVTDLQGLFAQATQLTKSPRVGVAAQIVKPLDAIHSSQQQIERIRRAQHQETNKILREIRGKQRAADFTRSNRPTGGAKASKDAGDLAGVLG